MKEPGPDGKLVTRKVEVLKPTDWLVVEGLMRARSGDKVEPKHVYMQISAAKAQAAPRDVSLRCAPR